MVNQTLIPTEKKYPPRFVIPDNYAAWDKNSNLYTPSLSPEFELIQERLDAAGVEIANIHSLMELAKLSTRQAVEIYGPAIADIRHPLGRTGINGTGVFWKAGKSQTADMAIMRDNPAAELEIALVFNRGKWRLPGGFIEESDSGNLKNTALREGTEETGMNLAILDDQSETLVPEQVKPNSSRSVDLGYISSQVEVVLLPEIEMSFDLASHDDAEAAGWFSRDEVLYHYEELGQISADHFAYVTQAFDWGRSKLNS